MTSLDRRRFLQLLSLSSLALATGCVRTPSGSTAVTGGGLADPTNVLVTRWLDDQFSKGSYSYLSLENRPDDRELLAASIGGVLFFAGEATSASNPATVHGAVMSGWDTADEIESVSTPGATVAVIGAGASGLAAARQLVDAGYEVIVFEARDRIGGRVDTDTSLGVPIDLGASWIQGSSGNPMTAIAENLGSPTVRTDWESTVTYNSSGDVIPANFWGPPIRAVNDAKDRGLTLEEAVNVYLDGQDQDFIDVFNFAVVAEFEHEYAADISALSALAPHEGAYFGGADLLLPNGYLELLETIAGDLDVRLSTPVSSVTWGEQGATVETSAESIAVDKVLVTLPLGVLQAGDVAFSPTLPDEKLAVIDRFGMGLLDKVVLEFDRPFWNRRVEYFGYVADDRGRWAQWYDMQRVTGKPLLIAMHAGSAAERLEGLSDDEIAAEAMGVLTKIYG